MKFVKLHDPGQEHDGIEVLLCDVFHCGVFTFKTAVRADWEAPRGAFHKEYCTIFDLSYAEGSCRWYVFRSSSSHLIRELRDGQVTRQGRLHLLLGYDVVISELWTIKRA